MAIFLHIETATEICSVAISRDGALLSLCESNEATSHASVLTLQIEQCLAESHVTLNEIDAVSVSSGPGSYTSLRIGTSVAKGICYALDKFLIVVDTLQALAIASAGLSRYENAIFCPMIDARRMEVYTAFFDASGERRTANEAKIVTQESFLSEFENYDHLVLSGNGSPKCAEVLKSPKAVFSPTFCSAAHHIFLTKIAFVQKKFEDAARYVPTYGKAPNITVSTKIL